MVSFKRVYERMGEFAKTGTSGYDDQDAINNRAYSVNLMLAEIMSENYEKNQKATDAVADLVEIELTSSDIYGQVEKNEEYLHLATVHLIKDEEIYLTRKLAVNAVAATLASSVRKPDYANNEVCYSFQERIIQMYPKMEMDLEVIYIRKPNTPFIALTPVDSENSDFLVVDEGNTVDFEWPESMFNLIVYMMLDQLGIEMKEQLLFEYATFGISRDTVNPNQP